MGVDYLALHLCFWSYVRHPLVVPRVIGPRVCRHFRRLEGSSRLWNGSHSLLDPAPQDVQLPRSRAACIISGLEVVQSFKFYWSTVECSKDRSHLTLKGLKLINGQLEARLEMARPRRTKFCPQRSHGPCPERQRHVYLPRSVLCRENCLSRPGTRRNLKIKFRSANSG